jgi:hypothetical protein
LTNQYALLFCSSPANFLRRPFEGQPNRGAGLKVAIGRGWLVPHASGTYVKFPQQGVELFASRPGW